MNSWWQTLVTAQGNGGTLTAAAAASALPSEAVYTLPANCLNYVGQQLLVKASGRISSVITTPGTARFDLRFGSTVVADSLAILLDTAAAHTNVGWTLEMLLTLRAVGASASLFMQGTWACEDILGVPATAPKGSLVAILPWNSAPAVGNTFDSTATQAVNLYFTQTVATGSMTLHQYALIACQ